MNPPKINYFNFGGIFAFLFECNSANPFKMWYTDEKGGIL